MRVIYLSRSGQGAILSRKVENMDVRVVRNLLSDLRIVETSGLDGPIVGTIRARLVKLQQAPEPDQSFSATAGSTDLAASAADQGRFLIGMGVRQTANLLEGDGGSIVAAIQHLEAGSKLLDNGRPRVALAAGVAKNPGGRPTKWDDLWDIDGEMRADDPKVTDREIARAYNRRYPRREKATAKTLRNLRQSRK